MRCGEKHTAARDKEKRGGDRDPIHMGETYRARSRRRRAESERQRKRQRDRETELMVFSFSFPLSVSCFLCVTLSVYLSLFPTLSHSCLSFSLFLTFSLLLISTRYFSFFLSGAMLFIPHPSITHQPPFEQKHHRPNDGKA